MINITDKEIELLQRDDYSLCTTCGKVYKTTDGFDSVSCSKYCDNRAGLFNGDYDTDTFF